ncbi:unnamed protein product [Trichobilharzia regenti]|nr:unnamed protein product [Trichobilharzia regenti]
MISEAMKLKCQWGKFLSKVHGIHHQSNQYEIWEKQLCLLQIRMHELSRLTREIGLSMYINKDGCHHDNDDDDGSDKTVDDANNYNTSKLLNNAKQMDRISCGFKRCFSELDSLSYALNEIQSELTEKCRTSVNSNNNNNNNNTNDNTRNNSSMLSSSMINLDSQLLHEIEHLSSQLAVNRSILQRLIRLFESNCSSHSTRKHDRQQENVMEEQLDTTTITNPTESILQCLQNETSEPNTNEHLNQCEPENNPSVISVSNTVENKKSSIFSTILKMIHHIFPFGKHHFLIVLTGGFLFIVYMGFYIFSRSVICNNNNDNNSASRPLPSSSSTSPVSSSSSIPLTSSTSASHHDHNNNNNFNDFTAATANAYHKCPLDRDRLSNIFDYTNGMPPY